jgi:hypothetical protein
MLDRPQACLYTNSAAYFDRLPPAPQCEQELPPSGASTPAAIMGSRTGTSHQLNASYEAERQSWVPAVAEVQGMSESYERLHMHSLKPTTHYS